MGNQSIEKGIEKGIIEFLELKGAVVEGMQSGEIMIIKGEHKNKMILQKEGCPDIMCFYKGHCIGIEVKKNQKEVNHWIKQEKRFHAGEKIPDSYKREYDQIRYKQNILKNKGTHILTYEIKEVIDFINGLD